MNIPLFVPLFRVDETLEAIRDTLEKGWTGAGYKTLEFEEAWKKYTGLPQACFLNSATAGLHLAVAQMKRKYGWRDNDEIITTPLTFVSTNHAILYEKLTPVFADVDQYLCLDLQSVENRITNRTRAMMFVGLAGNTGQLAAIQELCQATGLHLILDGAHMAGTYFKLNDNENFASGVHVGHNADATVFSFQAVKNLPTADSGMICWRDPDMDAMSRKLSWLGINKDTYSRNQSTGYSWEYDVEDIGWKYNGNSVMAAMGLVALKYLDKDNNTRRFTAAIYDDLLRDTPAIQPVPMSPDCIPSRHLYQVLVDNRDEVIERLKAVGIGTGVHYTTNTKYRMYHGFTPKADAASKKLLSLPMHLKLTVDDIDRVADELKKAVEGVKAK